MLNGLDLFSGIGGISYALQDYVTTRAYCEIDRYARGVLLSRMESGDLHNAPIWNDVKTFPTKQLAGRIDIITGGFPCQDVSVAGKGAGIQGVRSGLFFEIVRLAEALQPKYIFLENVPLITKRGGVAVVRTLAESGYNCVWTTLSAQAVGALHKRERWFLLAEKSNVGNTEHLGRNGASIIRSDGTSMQDSETRQDETRKPKRAGSRGQIQECVWREGRKGFLTGQPRESDTIPAIRRISDEIPFRVERIKCLGNSVVPLQVTVAFEYLMALSSSLNESLA